MVQYPPPKSEDWGGHFPEGGYGKVPYCKPKKGWTENVRSHVHRGGVFWRLEGACEPTLQQDREPGAATPRKSGRLIASASRRSPAARAVTLLDVGALCQPGAAIAVCVQLSVSSPMPRPDARNLLSRTVLALITDSASGGRVGGGLVQLLPPRVDPRGGTFGVDLFVCVVCV